MTSDNRIKILCVDDEPLVIEAITDTLYREFDVLAATSGAEALAILAREDVEVIVSDMRMPEMDGATLLARALTLKPDVPRILLTGHADLSAAVAAVNNGQLFRFLTKPCEAEQLRGALRAGVELHRLRSAERVLLEKTLHGSVAALLDILNMTNPAVFGRAHRIKARVAAMAQLLELPSSWQVEMAAMLQPIAFVTLPHETADKLYAGRPLNADEQRMVAHLPKITEQLLGHIPRIEEVRAMLAQAARPSIRDASLVDAGAAMLRIAGDLEDLELQGESPAQAAGVVRGRVGVYPERIVAAATRLAQAEVVTPTEVIEVRPGALRIGMVFVDDVKMASGALVVARGYEVTAGFLARVQNFPDGALRVPLRVIATKRWGRS